MIKENLKKYRKMRGLTQRELAELTGVSTGYIQMIELGKKNNPSVDLLQKISEALEVGISTLIGLDEVAKPLPFESLYIEMLDSFEHNGYEIIEDNQTLTIKMNGKTIAAGTIKQFLLRYGELKQEIDLYTNYLIDKMVNSFGDII